MIRYNEEHEWVRVEGDIGLVGISKYAVKQLGDITFLELPELEDDINAGESVAFIESVKAASDIYTPVSGEVIEINEALLDTPELLNANAEGTFIFKVKISDESELESLMDAQAYAAYTQSL